MFVQRVLKQCPRCPEVKTLRLAMPLATIPARWVFSCPNCGEEWAEPVVVLHEWEPEGKPEEAAETE